MEKHSIISSFIKYGSLSLFTFDLYGWFIHRVMYLGQVLF